MESFLVPFANFAPYLTDPLVLAGFGLLLVFSIHRALITSKLIPPLSQRSGTKIVRLILHYGFLSALALIVLGSVLRYGDMREKNEDSIVGVDGVETAVAGNTEAVAKAPVEASAGNTSPPVAQASSASRTGAVTIGEGAIVKSNAGPGGTSIGVNTGTITSTNIYNASPDERQALAHRLGVSVTTLERLLKNMEQAQIPANRRDEKLRELTEQYKTRESQVAEVRPQHAKVEELKASARKALEKGELVRAKDILVQAKAENRAPRVSVVATDVCRGYECDSSRLFTERTKHPPEEFSAFGIVAFPFAPTRVLDYLRLNDVCMVFLKTRSLYHPEQMGVLREKPMVTAWPVTSDALVDALNGLRNSDTPDANCSHATKHYDHSSSQQAIHEAKMVGAEPYLRGKGPYLLAWAPGETKGAQDAPLLLADLSYIDWPFSR